MRKAIVLLAAGSFVFYVAAVLSTLHIAKRPVFETVVPKPSTGTMALDMPPGPRIEPAAAASLSVMSSDDQVVGQVAGVTEGSNGATKWILVETGGFLGLGSRMVRISANNFSIGDDAIYITYSARELDRLPEVDRAR